MVQLINTNMCQILAHQIFCIFNPEVVKLETPNDKDLLAFRNTKILIAENELFTSSFLTYREYPNLDRNRVADGKKKALHYKFLNESNTPVSFPGRNQLVFVNQLEKSSMWSKAREVQVADPWPRSAVANLWHAL